jgi:hypothetical protein
MPMFGCPFLTGYQTVINTIGCNIYNQCLILLHLVTESYMSLLMKIELSIFVM